MTNTNYELRDLAQIDFKSWLPLWQGYLEFYETDLTEDVTQATWNRFFDPSEKIYAIGIFRAQNLVGFAHYTFHRSTWTAGHYCYLEDLFVNPKVRGAGAGRQLIEDVQARAKTNQCVRLYWVTNENNARARGLYDQLAELSDFVQYRVLLK